jgi:hypothetical protein
MGCYFEGRKSVVLALVEMQHMDAICIWVHNSLNAMSCSMVDSYLLYFLHFGDLAQKCFTLATPV